MAYIMAKTIICPSRLETNYVINFINDFWNDLKEPIIYFDFSEISYVFPYSTLILAESIREFVQKRKSLGLTTSVANIENIQKSISSAISYLKYFGFFQFIGLRVGNMPNFDKGSLNYLPITTLSSEELLKDSELKLLQEKIDKRSDRLAETIFKNQNPEAQIMVSYCFREIIRNVFEHAEIDYCTFMAQSWDNGDVEIALVDRGIGIYKSLSKVYNFKNTEEALKFAIKPGISSKIDVRDRSKWANSGFGLYVVSELGYQLGEFSILSNNRLLTISNENQILSDLIFHGTAIKLRINIEDADYFPNILHNIVKKGEELVAESGKRISASKMSKEIRKIL